MSSDHAPVVLTLSNALTHKFEMPELTSKNTDWAAFAENVNLRTRLKTEKKLEEDLNSLIESAALAAKQATPAIPASQSRKRASAVA